MAVAIAESTSFIFRGLIQGLRTRPARPGLQRCGLGSKLGRLVPVSPRQCSLHELFADRTLFRELGGILPS
jgi:hypothetical protein